MAIDLRDAIEADLRRKLDRLSGAGRDKVLKAGGLALVSLGKRSFTDPAARPAAWVARKKKYRHGILIKRTLLRKSLRVASVQSGKMEIGSDRPYARAHQLGAKKRKLPARPFLPFVGWPANASLSARGRKVFLAAMRAQAAAELGRGK